MIFATPASFARLNSGVDPVEVARRAGHSVAVLLMVYPKCPDGATAMANARIDDALSRRQ
ncbi:site-specific integrase [Streptomyces caniscabiei]|uniref:hypothetical protein n=1 Tax=Streptomyces caniscabiei TaxID=2746961 RepID=UPI00397738F3